MSKKNAIGLYKVDLELGNAGTPGAPILNLSLLVNATNGEIVGQGEVKQAVQGDTTIHKISGKVASTGFGEYTKVVSLSGEAFISFPPPAIGSYLAPFHSSFAVNNEWDGKGGWQIGKETVEDVPVKNVDHG